MNDGVYHMFIRTCCVLTVGVKALFIVFFVLLNLGLIAERAYCANSPFIEFPRRFQGIRIPCSVEIGEL